LAPWRAASGGPAPTRRRAKKKVNLAMERPVQLSDVFGIRVNLDPQSYVDRGSLDERMTYLLSAARHIVIHGDSKQGKSWLRNRVLRPEEVIVVQCQPGTTSEQILKQALSVLGVRAELKRTDAGDYEGSIEISASGQMGIKLITALGLTAKLAGKASAGRATESAPVGQTAGDLGWVARILAASERRLVIEDFHYVSEENKKDAAFLIKALGDYSVFLIIVGVWPHDHLLSYYNGDLEGRVEDIHLQWSNRELEEVLKRGATVLNIGISPGIRDAIIEDSYGNVGLLQRLAEAICRSEGVLREDPNGPYITAGPKLSEARATVANSMRGRFEAFADNFVQGLRRLNEGHEAYKKLLKVVTLASDEELMSGLSRSDLLTRMSDDGSSKFPSNELSKALHRIDALQAKINIRPAILAYSRDTSLLRVVDKSFLFFRKYGNPSWPWSEPEFRLSNDLALTDPIDVGESIK
jgi:hypothetical protein